MEQLHPDVYVETSYQGGNVGCIRTDEGLILIDAPLHLRDARIWRARLTQLTGQEVRYVISTSYQSYPILSYQALAPAPIIAHQTVWERIENWSEGQRQRVLEVLKREQAGATSGQKGLQIVRPRLTFTGRMILYCGGKNLRLIHLGGHSPSAIGVYLPEEEILFSGDVISKGQHPVMEEADTVQWLRTLTDIRRLQVRVIVPRHGPLCTKEDTQQLSAYIRLLRRRVRSQIKAGRRFKEAVENIDLQELMDFFPFEETTQSAIEKRIESSLRRIYEELQAEGQENEQRAEGG